MEKKNNIRYIQTTPGVKPLVDDANKREKGLIAPKLQLSRTSYAIPCTEVQHRQLEALGFIFTAFIAAFGGGRWFHFFLPEGWRIAAFGDLYQVFSDEDICIGRFRESTASEFYYDIEGEICIGGFKETAAFEFYDLEDERFEVDFLTFPYVHDSTQKKLESLGFELYGFKSVEEGGSSGVSARLPEGWTVGLEMDAESTVDVYARLYDASGVEAATISAKEVVVWPEVDEVEKAGEESSDDANTQESIPSSVPETRTCHFIPVNGIQRNQLEALGLEHSIASYDAFPGSSYFFLPEGWKIAPTRFRSKHRDLVCFGEVLIGRFADDSFEFADDVEDMRFAVDVTTIPHIRLDQLEELLKLGFVLAGAMHRNSERLVGATVRLPPGWRVRLHLEATKRSDPLASLYDVQEIQLAVFSVLGTDILPVSQDQNISAEPARVRRFRECDISILRKLGFGVEADAYWHSVLRSPEGWRIQQTPDRLELHRFYDGDDELRLVITDSAEAGGNSYVRYFDRYLRISAGVLSESSRAFLKPRGVVFDEGDRSLTLPEGWSWAFEMSKSTKDVRIILYDDFDNERACFSAGESFSASFVPFETLPAPQVTKLPAFRCLGASEISLLGALGFEFETVQSPYSIHLHQTFRLPRGWTWEKKGRLTKFFDDANKLRFCINDQIGVYVRWFYRYLRISKGEISDLDHKRLQDRGVSFDLDEASGQHIEVRLPKEWSWRCHDNSVIIIDDSSRVLVVSIVDDSFVSNMAQRFSENATDGEFSGERCVIQSSGDDGRCDVPARVIEWKTGATVVSALELPHLRRDDVCVLERRFGFGIITYHPYEKSELRLPEGWTANVKGETTEFFEPGGKLRVSITRAEVRYFITNLHFGPGTLDTSCKERLRGAAFFEDDTRVELPEGWSWRFMPSNTCAIFNEEDRAVVLFEDERFVEGMKLPEAKSALTCSEEGVIRVGRLKGDDVKELERRGFFVYVTNSFVQERPTWIAHRIRVPINFSVQYLADGSEWRYDIRDALGRMVMCILSSKFYSSVRYVDDFFVSVGELDKNDVARLKEISVGFGRHTCGGHWIQLCDEGLSWSYGSPRNRTRVRYIWNRKGESDILTVVDEMVTGIVTSDVMQKLGVQS